MTLPPEFTFFPALHHHSKWRLTSGNVALEFDEDLNSPSAPFPLCNRPLLAEAPVPVAAAATVPTYTSRCASFSPQLTNFLRRCLPAVKPALLAHRCGRFKYKSSYSVSCWLGESSSSVFAHNIDNLSDCKHYVPPKISKPSHPRKWGGRRFADKGF